MSYINTVYVSFIFRVRWWFSGDFGPTSLGVNFPMSDGLCGLAFAQGVQARGQTHDVKGLRRIRRSWEVGGEGETPFFA